MGGIETQVSGLVENQVAAGHEVFVLTLTDGMPIAGVKRFPFRLPKQILWHPRGKEIVKRELKQLNPDVVHLHFGAASPFAWDGLKAVSKLNIASVASVHSIWGSIARFLYSVVAKNWKSQTVFSSVSQVSSEIVKKSLRSDVVTVPNGVDISFWQNRDSKKESAKIEIVSATRFASRKRIRPQLKVISKIVAELGENSPHFTIAGNGPDFNYIAKQVKRENLENFVTLAGRLNRDELKALYQGADLFLQLSILEAFGIAACEASSAGLPVITRSGSGVSEFVEHGTNGYLENSDAAVVARIVELCKQPKLLQELKKSTREHPPIQNWQFVTNQVTALYEQAITRAVPQARKQV